MKNMRGLFAIPFAILLVLGLKTPAIAQSFLGTIRGTVLDPQGQVVPGAAVVITDEATGVPRTLETDGQGRYEAPDVRPGTYRVEVITPNFKKFERTGVVLRAAGTALVDATLELGSLNETVTVSADLINNITLDNPAIARGLDEQQLHDLPRDGRDIQSFLLLNPNVVAGTDERHLRDGRQLRAGPRCGVGDQRPLELLQCRIRRSGRRRRHDEARSEHLPRHNLLRFQQQRPERVDVQPDTLGCQARRSTLGHARVPVGREHGRSCGSGKTFLLRELRRFKRQEHLRGQPGHCSYRGDAERRLPRYRDRAQGSDDGAALPGSGDARQPYRSGGSGHHALLLSAAQSRNHGQWLRCLPAVRARDAPPAAGRPEDRLRGEQERFGVHPFELSEPGSQQHLL